MQLLLPAIRHNTDEGVWHWQADESGATISVGMGSGGEGEGSEGGTSMRLNAPPRARRTPRGGPAPSIMRSGGRVSLPLARLERCCCLISAACHQHIMLHHASP